MNILWLGFGKMGEPMAARVAAAGHVVHVFDVSEARRAVARGLNLDVVTSLDDAVADADAIISSLPNDAVALHILAGEESALRYAKPGALLIETSTISVAASAAIAKRAAAQEMGYLRAPVSGSVAAAANGALTTFMSGPEAAVERGRPIVSAWASTIRVVGDAEQARVMKLAVNLMVTTLVASLGEAYALCTKGGIEPKVALDAISASAIGSPHLKVKADALERLDFTPAFTVVQMRKDLRLITDGARDLTVPILLGTAVEQIMAAAEASGLGDEDYLACAKVIAGLSGLKI
ncbi:NAD(P)-dependent oxidoreductase [Paraburkholderia saeva]|uniref:2-(Hydroxymethyl)glutarate dehydrogenase n=1 Tax=Paraburkholderia saeva TaxID=2777537 RepID=A0A9N8X3G9_9BURK|nr:NAD(P)-dependent oxidoreductase [Paraburkholderia saeva]CAG4913109.1 2-(hydroxymethyl)glutarate dehydrogenase [Paraburkholderia saeva]